MMKLSAFSFTCDSKQLKIGKLYELPGEKFWVLDATGPESHVTKDVGLVLANEPFVLLRVEELTAGRSALIAGNFWIKVLNKNGIIGWLLIHTPCFKLIEV
jgi:hypothetical protein